MSEPVHHALCDGESTSTLHRETTLLRLFLCLLSQLPGTPLKSAFLNLHTTSIFELAFELAAIHKKNNEISPVLAAPAPSLSSMRRTSMPDNHDKLCKLALGNQQHCW